MCSHVVDSLIYGDFFSSDEMRAVFDDRHLVQCWLDVEAALARAEAKVGIIPASAAEEITRQAHALPVDLAALRAGTNLVGYPILPLVRQLAAQCSAAAGHYVHWGATTQDIMDTANVLQVREALDLISRDLRRLIQLLLALAQRHRDTVMAGRTHGQQALPITFGFKVAVWIDELERHVERLAQLRPRVLRCEFGGAAGTLASLGVSGWDVHTALAAELELTPAPIAWHSARDGFAEFVGLCAMVGATLGKLAREVATLQQTEFAEVEEPFVSGKGASSTMPQKRNPILCEAVIGIAQILAQQTPMMLSAMKPEHERAMGEWHVEWDVMPHACQLIAAALRHSIDIFGGLVVHPGQMQSNLELTRGQIVAEAVMMRLGEYIGRQEAHDVVYAACEKAVAEESSLLSVLLQDARVRVHLSEADLINLVDPANYLGLSQFFVDAILDRYA